MNSTDLNEILRLNKTIEKLRKEIKRLKNE